MDKISRNLLLDLLDGCKTIYPSEFFAYLGKTKGVIDHFVVVPIMFQNENSVSYYRHNKPVDFSIVGTIHSHPSGHSIPSSADLNSFFGDGDVHIIAAYPFNLQTVSVYDSKGNKISLELV